MNCRLDLRCWIEVVSSSFVPLANVALIKASAGSSNSYSSLSDSFNEPGTPSLLAACHAMSANNGAASRVVSRRSALQ